MSARRVFPLACASIVYPEASSTAASASMPRQTVFQETLNTGSVLSDITCHTATDSTSVPDTGLVSSKIEMKPKLESMIRNSYQLHYNQGARAVAIFVLGSSPPIMPSVQKPVTHIALKHGSVDLRTGQDTLQGMSGLRARLRRTRGGAGRNREGEKKDQVKMNTLCDCVHVPTPSKPGVI